MATRMDERRSPRDAGPDAGRIDRLKPNAVGLVGVIFMAVATAAPITAMSGNVPVAVGYGNGTGAPAGYIFATVVLTIFSVGYVAMARHITAAGAFYGFISHGLGRVVGMGSGFLAVLAYSVFEASIVGIFAYFANSTFDAQLGIDVPWQVFAAVMLALNAALAFFDINVAAKILAVVLVTEIAVLAIMAVAVLVQGGGPDGVPLSPINPVNAFGSNGLAAGAVGFGLFMAFWSWVGFESTAMYGEESKNPKRIVPLATLLCVTGIGAFYVFVSWMAIAGTGLSQSIKIAGGSDPLQLFVGPTQTFVGGWAVDLFRWLLMTGSFACGFAFHNCAARYLYAFGREGFLWRGLGRTHRVHGSPHVASFVQSVVAAIIVLAFAGFGEDPYLSLYVLMAILGTAAILIVQTLCSFAVIGYFHVRGQHPETRNAFRTLLAPLVGGIGMAVVVVLLYANRKAAAGAAAETLLFDLIFPIVIVTFLAGVALALYLRARDPAAYRRIGRVIFEEGAERPGLDETGDGHAERLAATTTGYRGRDAAHTRSR
jgi:amino acid transporter